MNALKSLELMSKYADCPKCGNAMVGNGEGTLDITDTAFKRTCKCGWKAHIVPKERVVTER